MIIQAVEALLSEHGEAAHKIRARVGRRGDAPPVVRADGAELGGALFALPLSSDVRAELAALEAACASAAWPVGRFLRLEVLDGTGAPLGSRSLPSSTWSGRAPAASTAERVPWGPAGPAPRWLEPDEAPRPAPTWPAELVPPAPRPAPGQTAPASAEGPLLAMLGQSQSSNLEMMRLFGRLAEVSVQTAAKVTIEAAAQHAQSSRSASAQLGALSAQVASVAERAAERADAEAERAGAAVEMAAAADKAGALAELAAKLGGGGADAEGGGGGGAAKLMELGLALMAGGARPVMHGRPPGQTPPAAAAPAAQLEDAAPPAGPTWSARLLEALLEAQHDPSAPEQLAALGAALPAPVRAAIAGGVA
jgi:hypothetical protein